MKKRIRQERTINMTVTDTSNFLSPYSQEGKPVISSEVADFLENCAKEFHPKDSIRLNITCPNITEKEKSVFNRAIINYFYNKLCDLIRTKKRKNLFGILCSSIGILALAFMFIGDSLNFNNIVIEYIDIFAWVFIWEAVDILFVERSLYRLKISQLLSIINMPINYINNEITYLKD